MNNLSERKSSGALNTYWLDSTPASSYPKLENDHAADILVIGAGMTGLTAAYLLAKKGRKVTIIDSGNIWSGETGRTTAHLTEEFDAGYAQIEKLHGEKNAKLMLKSQRAALQFIDETVRELNVDCEFSRVDAYLFLHPTDKKESLQEELETLHRIGWPEVQMTEAAIPGFEKGPCLRFPNQAQFHPLKYLAALAAEVITQGGVIFSNTRAQAVESGKVTTADDHTITAAEIIVATHSPIKNILFFLKEAAYRTYVIGAEIPKGSVARALYWDTGSQGVDNDPYHYVRVTAKNETSDLLIAGGEDHKTGQADDAAERFKKLEYWTKKRFPMMGAVEYRWSGQVIEPVDGLPYIGKSPHHKNLYIATGYSGNGMTNGTLAGMILTDLILGVKNKWEGLFNPTRKTLHSSLEFVKENLNMAKVLVTDRLRKETASAEDLAPGEGAIVQKGVHKIAAYRDEDGKLSECSATCTHLGCVVQWNTAEKTFDCPCHGSRFTGEGQVITGPALTNLKKIEPD